MHMCTILDYQVFLMCFARPDKRVERRGSAAPQAVQTCVNHGDNACSSFSEDVLRPKAHYMMVTRVNTNLGLARPSL